MAGVEALQRRWCSRTDIEDVVSLLDGCDLKGLSLFEAGFEVGGRRLRPCVQLQILLQIKERRELVEFEAACAEMDMAYALEVCR